jgi:hypothetical protein
MIGTKSFQKKKKNSDEAIKILWVAAILVSRSERGNKQYFILGPVHFSSYLFIYSPIKDPQRA